MIHSILSRSTTSLLRGNRGGTARHGRFPVQIRRALGAPARAWTRCGQALAASLACAIACAGSAPAARAESLSTLGGKLQTMFTDLAKPLQIGFAFGGFFLVGVGLWQLYQRSQRPGEPKGGAIIAIFVGGALIGASVIAKSTATSLTGSEGVASALGL